MNNILKYFYNIDISDISFKDNYYYFIYEKYSYKLYIIDYLVNEDEMFLLNKEMLKYTLVSKIIMNKFNKIVTEYNGIKYMLLRIYVSNNKLITLDDIRYLTNLLYINNININWGILWSKKIDYLEEVISENGKKYPILTDSFNYFVGLAENAIAYYNNTIIDNNYKYVISHKRIKYDSTLEDLYNPLNIIFDYRVRDVGEYIKAYFFRNDIDIFALLDNYLNKEKISLMEVRLLISRILYPSFYFDLYEDILINGQDEKIIIPIIKKLEDYQLYLAKIISYFKKYYDIESIDWLNKKTFV